MQQRSPLITQLESSLIIYYLGDLCSQTISSNVFLDAQYEPIRGLRAMLIGSISSIPSYKWFLFLGNNFNYSSHLLSLTVKVVINQTFFTPIFNTYFFGMQTLLSGGSWQDAKERVINTVPVSWYNSCKVWPAVTAFSFTFIPWQYRNVFAGVIAIGWQSYLTWLNRKEEIRVGLVHEEERKEEKKVEEEQKPIKKRKKKRKAEAQEGTGE
jgi:protein Mpv17